MLCAVGYSFIVSFLIFKIVNFIVPIRVSDIEEEEGLDSSQHNEMYIHNESIMSVTREGLELEKV